MTIRTQLKAGRLATNHHETMRVRSALKAGGIDPQHNEALRVRSTIKAGGVDPQHNETLVRAPETPAISMRRLPRTTAPKGDRLALLVVRAGLRAGLGRRGARGRGR